MLLIMKLKIILFVVIGACSIDFTKSHWFDAIEYIDNDIDSDFREYDKANQMLTIIKSSDKENLALYNKMEKIAKSMGYSVRHVTLAENDVMGTIDASNRYGYVINLKMSVKDLYNDHNKYRSLVESNLLCTPDCNDHSKYTSLISSSILEHGKLLRVIENDNLELKDYIQICLPRNTPNRGWYTHKLNVIFKDLNFKIQEGCGDIPSDSSMLAMITNSPPETDSTLPTIFYQTPFILPELKDRFPNSLSLSANWQPLKYAFKEMLKNMQWYRVAILSDDTVYSQQFEVELTTLLRMEGIVFTDQRCGGRFCNFTQPLQLLKESDAKIIILNVEKGYAMKLVDTINNLRMPGVTWIVRDWPFDDVGQIMNDIFSISLSSTFDDENKFYPYLSSIIKGFQIIESEYQKALGDREMFTREFANQARKTWQNKTNAYIIRIHDQKPSIVASMSIEGGTVKVFQFTNVYQGRTPADTSQKCIVRSYNFFKPCDHVELFLLVFVSILFLSLFFLVIEFFNRCRKRMFYDKFS